MSCSAVSQESPYRRGLYPEGFPESGFRREAQEGVCKRVQEIFRNRLGIDDKRVFQKIWSQAEHEFHWAVKDPLTEEAKTRIEKALRGVLVYTGPGVDIEDTRKGGFNPKIRENAQYSLGKEFPISEWTTKEKLESIFVKRDVEMLKGMEEEYRIALASCANQVERVAGHSPRFAGRDGASGLGERERKLFAHLLSGESPTLGEGEFQCAKGNGEVVFESFVGNIISSLSHCHPEEGATFVIPQKVDGQWKRCTYRVDQKIELTPGWFSTPIAAYGLVSEDGPPLLTFIGTAYPASDGFIATVLSDFTPGISVGYAPYLLGKKKIEQWLEGKQGVRLFGRSLGGAMAFQVLRHHREKIGSVDAFNAPGLYPWNWKELYDEGPKINVYYQDSDIVGTVGIFPEGRNVSIYRVFSEKTENILKTHMRAYPGSDEVTVLKSDPGFENSRTIRKILTVLHVFLGPILIFLPALVLFLLYAILIKPFLILRSKCTQDERIMLPSEC